MIGLICRAIEYAVENNRAICWKLVEFNSWVWSVTEGEKPLSIPQSLQGYCRHTQSCTFLRSKIRGLSMCVCIGLGKEWRDYSKIQPVTKIKQAKQQ